MIRTSALKIFKPRFLSYSPIFFVLLGGLTLRLILISQSLWLDEAISVVKANYLSFSEIIYLFSPGDLHPPFYYLLLKFWINFFGSSEISVRALSVLFSLGTIYLVYKIAKLLPIARDYANFPILSALFLAINPLHIYYSQEARMYSLTAFLASLLIYEILSRQRLLIMTLLSSLALYTFYPLIFLLITLGIYVYFYHKKVFKKYLSSVGLSLLLFSPWISTFKFQIESASTIKSTDPLWWQVLGQTGPREFALVWIKFIIGRINFLTRKGYLSFVAVVSLLPALALLKSFIHRSKISILWFWLLGPLTMFFIFGFVGAGFSYFRFLFILPAFVSLIAAGISVLPRSWRNFSIFLIIIAQFTAIFIFWLNPRFHRENWRDSVAFINANSKENSLAAFPNIGQSDPYVYYSSNKAKAVGPQEWQMENPDEIWLFRYAQPIFDPEDRLPHELISRNYVKLAERDFGGIVIWHYQKKQK